MPILISNHYDIIFIIIISLSAIIAAFYGLINEILSLSKWFITLYLMHKFGYLLQNTLNHIVTNQTLQTIIIYFIIFIFVAIIIFFIKRLCNNLINSIDLFGANHLLGFIFGAIKGIFICALIIIIIQSFNLDKQFLIKKSALYPVIYKAQSIILQNCTLKQVDNIGN